MSMEQFFEAWVETLMSRVARQVGGMLRTGRERQTVMPLTWEPPYLGSQKSLIPDLVIERGDTTTIIDAKYKEHWGGNARTAVVRPGGGTAGASPRRPSSSARVLYGRADS